jgi:hypothetical protein
MRTAPNMWTYVCVCVYARICTHTHAYTHIYTHTFLYTRKHTYHKSLHIFHLCPRNGHGRSFCCLWTPPQTVLYSRASIYKTSCLQMHIYINAHGCSFYCLSRTIPFNCRVYAHICICKHMHAYICKSETAPAILFTVLWRTWSRNLIRIPCPSTLLPSMFVRIYAHLHD